MSGWATLAAGQPWEAARELWTDPLYRQALLGGTAVAVAGSLLSVFVVLKRMAFIGQGVTHTAFGGMALALLAGLFVPALREPLARDGLVAGFCVMSALAIGFLSRRGRLGEDAAIGIALVTAMALGLLLLDLRTSWLQEMVARGELTRAEIGYAPSLHDLLFGDILFGFSQRSLAGGVSVSLAPVAWILAGAVAVAVVVMYRPLVFFTFDEEAATAFGVRTGWIYYGLLVCLALTIWVTMRAMGVILTSAVLILPGAAGRLSARKIQGVLAVSLLAGLAGMAGGLWLAIWLGRFSPAGVIVAVLVAELTAAYVVRSVRLKLGRRRNRADSAQERI